MNARGNNVYVRPGSGHGLVLLDSIKAEHIGSLRSKGFAPAISIEVTRNEFQAWVRLSNHALPERLRRLAEEGLVSALSGTGNRLVRSGYGWLAGCVNHGDSRDRPQREKYVLAHASSVEIGKQTNVYVPYDIKSPERMAEDQGIKSKVQPLSNQAAGRTRGR
jgi:hypothetical protein